MKINLHIKLKRFIFVLLNNHTHKMDFISSELQKDVKSNVFNKLETFYFVVDRNNHTKDWELSVISHDTETEYLYLYNGPAEALTDMNSFIDAGFIVEDL